MCKHKWMHKTTLFTCQTDKIFCILVYHPRLFNDDAKINVPPLYVHWPLHPKLLITKRPLDSLHVPVEETI